ARIGPGSAAGFGAISPDPAANGPAGVVPSSSRTSGLAVVINEDLIAAGLHVGCSWVSSAAAPVTCGAAIDVPLIDWNSWPGRRTVLAVGHGGVVLRMLATRAVQSG